MTAGTEMAGLSPAAAAAEFFDSTRPHLIPAGADAALYWDGNYACPFEISARFHKVRWITIAGDARHAGIADYEPGNPVYAQPGLLHAWAAGRLATGHRARVYVQRSAAAAALAELGPNLATDPRVLYWIPTLDGRLWTAADLAADLAANWGAPIPESQLWANQYDGGPGARFDISRLYGTW